jgi:hypothetical protein
MYQSQIGDRKNQRAPPHDRRQEFGLAFDTPLTLV